MFFIGLHRVAFLLFCFFVFFLNMQLGLKVFFLCLTYSTYSNFFAFAPWLWHVVCVRCLFSSNFGRLDRLFIGPLDQWESPSLLIPCFKASCLIRSQLCLLGVPNFSCCSKILKKLALPRYATIVVSTRLRN
jgi:hypothetical protein